MKPIVNRGPALPLLALAATASAFFPPTPKDAVTVQSQLGPGISISYKQTHICETTPGVKSYSGYVHLPPSPADGRDFDVNTFFWFFESRKDPANAPLSLWLQGGPGVPSITAAVGENGPCSIAENSRDTILNPWSWNNEVNMLYVDQPVQVGFSYDSLANGTINQLRSPVAVTLGNFSDAGVPVVNDTLFVGTFPSQDKASSVNTSATAALAIWHFMQTWTQEFPEYKPSNDRISIWSESYGGHWAPTFADYFEHQNDLVRNGSLGSSAKLLHLDTVGIINGCSDIITQMPGYPQMAYNNTYGVEFINQTVYEASMKAFPTCEKLSLQCRALAAASDPQGYGRNETVNKACQDAFLYCFGTMWAPYSSAKKPMFDIGAEFPNPFPPKWAAGYFNTKEIQEALGVPLNFTGQSTAVSDIFNITGDFVRGDNLGAFGRLLDRNVKVALVYGDRDYQCNWFGGERLSLAINSTFTTGFHSAGYADIQTNGSYIGGAVRQYGNLSFSRVFDAGHEVPYYQPETAYRIFSRVMSNSDVATGTLSTAVASNYSTTGPDSTFHLKNKLPPPHKQICYTWDVAETCTPDQFAILGSGAAITQDFILIGYKEKNGTVVMYNGNETQGESGNSSATAPASTGAGALALSTGLMGHIWLVAATVVGLYTLAL